MEERFDKMICPNCGQEMRKGMTVQGYRHPLVWYPGREALTYQSAVRLSYQDKGSLSGGHRFTSRFRTKPSFFPAWYCDSCELMVVDTKTEMEKA